MDSQYIFRLSQILIILTMLWQKLDGTQLKIESHMPSAWTLCVANFLVHNRPTIIFEFIIEVEAVYFRYQTCRQQSWYFIMKINEPDKTSYPNIG